MLTQENNKGMLRKFIMVVILTTSITICAAQFAGGDGSARDPWQVETAEHLNNIRNYIGPAHDDKHFIQTADIDLGVPPWNEDGGWEPIGGWVQMWLTFFHGSYDGNGYVIEGLTIDRAGDGRGLFGYAYDAEIKNLGLVDVNIQARNYVGGIIGRMEQATTVDNCFVTGKITGNNYVGGIAGYMRTTDELGNISNCYSTAKLELTGDAEDYQAGGIVGHFYAGRVINNYVCGAMYTPVPSPYIGGLIGKVEDDTGEITNNYWNVDITMQRFGVGDGIDDIPGNTTPEMMREETFAGFDFDRVWHIDEDESFPYLQWEGDEASEHNLPPLLPPLNLMAVPGDAEVNLTWEAPNEEVAIPDGYNVYRNDVRVNVELVEQLEYHDTEVPNWETHQYHVTAVYDEQESMPGIGIELLVYPGFAEGEGTEDDPYLISDAEQLNGIRFFLDAHYRQVQNIDLGVPPWNEDEGWEPIGKSAERFTGSYDGDFHLISNLTIDREENNIGLFGYTDDEAVIKNVFLRGVDVTGDGPTGALVGYAMSSTIEKCNSFGTVTGSNGVGGLIGRANNCEIRYCFTEGSVIATGANAGGLIGDFRGDNLYDSYSRASVTSPDYTIGGFIGWQFSDNVTRCYSTGEVIHEDPEDDRVGGFFGRFRGDEVTLCYWDMQTSGHEESQGGEGVMGKMTVEMVYPYEENVYVDWDFDDVWAHDEDRDLNDGYPLLAYYLEHLQRPAAPEVTADITEIEGVEYVFLNWEAVEDANSYKIYASENPYPDHWGEPVAIISDTQYIEPVEGNTRRFYYVTASTEEAP